jgi:hypothetical protein
VFDQFEPSSPEENGCGQPLGELEWGYILKVLRRTRGRIDGKQGVAMIMGLNPSTLCGRLRRRGIERFGRLATGAE